MKPALDATLWDEPTTGIALYTRELHAALTRNGLDVERWGARRTGEVPRGRTARTLWTVSRLPALLEERRPRLFHALSNFNLPLVRSHTPLVLTVHDLVPLLLPDTVSTPFRWQFRVWLSRSLAIADAVICVSETARQSVLRHFEVDARKLHVVPHGADHVERVAPPDETTVKWLDAVLPPENTFVLYAGALDARKNVQLVLRAVEKLHDQGLRVPLVLAGQRWFGAGPIEAELARVKARGVDVRALGYLSDSVFYALMKRAGVFVFPSRYEGFGLPPLEAMRLGVPTIVSTEGSLPEVCGGGAAQVGPDDTGALAVLLSKWLTDDAERSRQATRASDHAQKYVWADTARETARIYDTVG